MSRLFIELYIDEDVDVVLADLLRSLDFRVMTTAEAVRSGRSDSDEAQLAFAAERHWAIVTHNRRYFDPLAKRYLREGKHHWGIIMSARNPPQRIARRLLSILNDVTADEMRDQVRYI